MPHKKGTVDLQTSVTAVSTQQTDALSVEGFNSTNVAGMGASSVQTPQVQQQRTNEINHSIQYTNTHVQATVASQQAQHINTFGLVRPTVCTIPKAEDKMTHLDSAIAEAVALKIWDAVVYNKLYYTFQVTTKDELEGKCARKSPQERLQDVVDRATMHDYNMIMELLKIPSIDQATDLCVLALFDVVVLMDDSSSMMTTGNMEWTGTRQRTVDYEEGDSNDVSRWQHASSLVGLVSFILTLFDSDGISVRFLNRSTASLGGVADGIKTAEGVRRLFSTVSPNGGTCIAASIRRIYDEFIVDQIRTGTLSKPVLVITYTDGESSDDIQEAVRAVRKTCKDSQYGSRTTLFSFNQIGRDQKAREKLGDLDEQEDAVDRSGRKLEDGAGDITDCTSAYPDEEKEYNARQLKIPLEERKPYSLAFHYIKGLVGPVIEKYDLSDESKKPVAASGGFFGIRW